MTTFAASLKKEIARVARKELRYEISALRKGSAAHKSEIASLKRTLRSLELQIKAVSRATPESGSSPKVPSTATHAKPGRKVVFGAAEFLALRQQLGQFVAELVQDRESVCHHSMT